jgi:hypothetical protein
METYETDIVSNAKRLMTRAKRLYSAFDHQIIVKKHCVIIWDILANNQIATIHPRPRGVHLHHDGSLQIVSSVLATVQ